MIAKYKIEDKEDLINYAQFCENIDRIFGEGASPTEVIGGSKSTANFTSEEMELMVATLTEMRRQIVSNRVLLKPSFQDFDRTKSCHVTA